MNKNYTFWIIGVIVVIVIGFLLFTQSSNPLVTSPVATSTETADITDTNGTSDRTVGGAKPVVITTGFASVSSTTAIVVGTINPNGVQTTYWFEYGPTLSLGFSLNKVTAVSGQKQLGAAAYITGLKPSTPYYFRIGAKNAYGTVYGSPYSFITTSK